MKYFTFFRESDKFDDILDDTNLDKLIRFKLRWTNFLVIGIEQEKNKQTFSYITIKYGDDMKTAVVPDRSPIPNVDYVPKR